MALTIRQYTARLRTASVTIARGLGSDLSVAPKDLRVGITAVLVLLAVVLKTLVDKGVVTDAELNANLNAVEDALYDDEPVNP